MDQQPRKSHDSSASSRIPTAEPQHQGDINDASPREPPQQSEQQEPSRPVNSPSSIPNGRPRSPVFSAKPERKPPPASLPLIPKRDSAGTPKSAPRKPPKMPQYTSRDVGDPSQIKKTKQSMADLKLRRLTELNNRLREDLERERIPVSQASKSIIAYCNSTRDYMVPSVWGPVPKGEDPYAPQQSNGCCVVM
ncbi:Guanine nucleotide-binding protein subunit gamma [Podospora bellae-mahoneyi]|uniref:Guanine nucleotide-binding protein subunit gamma n=1 Tax=Podospora bellae-mahoneyi TaxID=2093777 RepID=A0ABR0F9A5_9PEZI|nr:Guanine nucleotide-binding protein subunit gamma [Podospora bellae-mahoneyi]